MHVHDQQEQHQNDNPPSSVSQCIQSRHLHSSHRTSSSEEEGIPDAASSLVAADLVVDKGIGAAARVGVIRCSRVIWWGRTFSRPPRHVSSSWPMREMTQLCARPGVITKQTYFQSERLGANLITNGSIHHADSAQKSLKASDFIGQH